MANISVFQPLFPEERVAGPLFEKAAAIVSESLSLAGMAQPSLSRALTPLLRAMNSYYSNKIEGQHTHPADIERAVHHQFDADVAKARKQRIALAHMEVEAEQEARFAGRDARTLFAPAVVADIHRSLYDKLPPEEQRTDEGEPITPGAWRARDVKVGRHIAPPHGEVPGLLEAWARAYAEPRGNEKLLVGLACSHHRLAWVHPFIDGNGRVARLHSHLMLHTLGLTQGLWSPMRGLARSQEEYYARLNNADLPRRNDYDGRGPLSQEELVKFADYFLGVCLDQIRFMRERLDFYTLKERFRALLRHLEDHPWQAGSEKSAIRPEVLEALHYVAISGPLERGRFLGMTGAGDRMSRRILASLIDYGILEADSHVAPVRLALPQKSLRFLFPNLWPEVDAS